jgi:hypothetical protein
VCLQISWCKDTAISGCGGKLQLAGTSNGKLELVDTPTIGELAVTLRVTRA